MHDTYHSYYKFNYRTELIVKGSKINIIKYMKLKLYHPNFMGLL